MTKKRFFAILSTAAQSAFLIFRQNVEFNGVFQSAKPFVKKSFFFSREVIWGQRCTDAHYWSSSLHFVSCSKMTGFSGNFQKMHCVNVSKYGIISGPYFPVFGLNTEIYSVNLWIQSEYKKIPTRNNSLFGHFSHSDDFPMVLRWIMCF